MKKIWKKIDNFLFKIVDLWIVLAGTVPLVIVSTTSLYENKIYVIIANIIAYLSEIIFAYVFIKGYLESNKNN